MPTSPAVTKLCPTCRSPVKAVPGEPARCPTCGTTFAAGAGAATRKICVGCGQDVAAVKRVKDDQGNYFCHPCWQEHLARQAPANGDDPSDATVIRDAIVPTDDEADGDADTAIRPATGGPPSHHRPSPDDLADDFLQCDSCQASYPSNVLVPRGDGAGSGLICPECLRAGNRKVIRYAVWAACGFAAILALTYAAGHAAEWAAKLRGTPSTTTALKPVTAGKSPGPSASPASQPTPESTQPTDATSTVTPAVSPTPTPPAPAPEVQPNAQPNALPPAQPTAPQSQPAPRTAPPPVAAIDVPLDPARPDKAMREIFALTTKALTQQDYVALARLASYRRQFVDDAQPGSSAMIDAWKADHQAVRKANQLVTQTRYSEAVALLQQRWQERKAYAAANNNEPIDGEVGVALCRASLAAVVLDDEWVLSRAEMATVARDVQKLDPTAVTARLLEAWLLEPDPAEELLSLDARPSTVARNRLLMPLRASLLRACPAYADAARDASDGFAHFQDDVVGTLGERMPGRTFREAIAPLEYTLGAGRQPAVREYDCWTTLLRRPSFYLYDGAGGCYAMAGGMLWKQVVGKDGLDWFLCVPPRDGGAPGRAWGLYSVRLMRWAGFGRNDDNPLPDGQAKLATRLDGAKPLPFDFPVVNGSTLKAYSARGVTPQELVALKIPMLEVSASKLQGAWQASGTLTDKSRQGRRLVFGGDPVQGGDQIVDFTFDTVSAQDVGIKPPTRTEQSSGLVPPPPERKFYTCDVPGLFINVERSAGADLALFDAATDRPYLLSAWGQPIYLQRENAFEVQTPGNGRVVLPVQGTRFNATAQRDAASRILRRSMVTSPWPSVDKLRELLEQYGRRGVGGESPTDFILKSVFEDAMPLRKPDEVQADQWSDVQRTFRTAVAQAKRQFCRTPYGYEPPPRGRLIWLTAHGMEFLDANGEAVAAYYSAADLDKLAHDAVNDFMRPSFATVPWPLFPQTCDATVPDAALLGLDRFMLAAAREVANEDPHLAATLYREIRSGVFDIPTFDPRQPRGRDEFNALVQSTGRAVTRGRDKLAARLELADLLDRARRSDRALEIRRSAAAEWGLAAVPLLDELTRYAIAYGYAPGPEVGPAMEEIRNKLKAIPRLPPPTFAARAAQSPSAAAPHFDPALLEAAKGTQASLEKWFDQYFDARPSLQDYCLAKQWILANAPRLRYRKPRSAFDVLLASWAPLDPTREELTPVSDAAVFDPSATDPVASAWRQVFYETETGRRADALAVRYHLLSLAALPIDPAAAEANARPALAAAVNRVTALWLAAGVEPSLPHGFGCAALDRDALDATRLEVDAFLPQRLASAGVTERDAARLLEPVRAVRQSVLQQSDDYAARRYFWFEYAPLAEDYRRFLRDRHDDPDLAGAGAAGLTYAAPSRTDDDLTKPAPRPTWFPVRKSAAK